MPPPMRTLISVLLLPPSTGLSCTRATFMPSLAADTAVLMPARPAPATTMSYEDFSAGRMYDRSSFLRSLSRLFLSFGRDSSGHLRSVKHIRSQRPSNPVRSLRATLIVSPPPKLPAYCQFQLLPSVPSTSDDGRPSMMSRNAPGPSPSCHGEVQLYVLT